MTDPSTAAADRIDNLEARTGGTCAAICRLIAESSSAKVCVQYAMPLDRLGVECTNAHARALHEALKVRIVTLCVVEPRPKKGCAQLRRKRSAALCLATRRRSRSD